MVRQFAPKQLLSQLVSLLPLCYIRSKIHTYVVSQFWHIQEVQPSIRHSTNVCASCKQNLQTHPLLHSNQHKFPQSNYQHRYRINPFVLINPFVWINRLYSIESDNRKTARGYNKHIQYIHSENRKTARVFYSLLNEFESIVYTRCELLNQTGSLSCSPNSVSTPALRQSLSASSLQLLTLG